MLEGETVRETCGTYKRYTEANSGKPTMGVGKIILAFWKFVQNDTRRFGTVERGLVAQFGGREREESLRGKRKRKWRKYPRKQSAGYVAGKRDKTGRISRGRERWRLPPCSLAKLAPPPFLPLLPDVESKKGFRQS